MRSACAIGSGVAADDDASVLRRAAMQSNEMQTVVGQDRATLRSGRGEHLIVRQASASEAEHCEGEHIMPEHAQARGDAVIEVFVSEEERHQAAAFSVTRRSISSRCSP